MYRSEEMVSDRVRVGGGVRGLGDNRGVCSIAVFVVRSCCVGQCIWDGGTTKSAFDLRVRIGKWDNGWGVGHK